jgi:hypothetical protein
MKTIVKLFIVLFIFGCGVLIVLLIWSNSNSFARKVLSKPDESIKAWLLERTPLGTSMDNVRAYATNQQGWVIYDDNEGWSTDAPGSGGKGPSGPYFCGTLGRYSEKWFEFDTCVAVFWVFDSSNRLDNILIWKTAEGL